MFASSALFKGLPNGCGASLMRLKAKRYKGCTDERCRLLVVIVAWREMNNNVLLMNNKVFRFSITPGKFRKIFPEFCAAFGGENQRFYMEACTVNGQKFKADIHFWRGCLRDIHFRPVRQGKCTEGWQRAACDEWLFAWLGIPDEQNMDTTYYKCPWGYAAVEYEAPDRPDCFVIIGFKR